MKEYHFSLGNSDKGPIGYCAVVKAASKADAVEVLRAALPQEHPVIDGYESIVYLTVYFNEAAVKASAIDEITEGEFTR